MSWNGSYSTALLLRSQPDGYVSASVPFSWNQAGFGGAWGARSGDFDADGTTDLLSYVDDRATARRQLSLVAGFQESSISFTWNDHGVGGAFGGQAGDFDGDGATDVVSWSGSETEIRLQQSTSSGVTETIVPFRWYSAGFGVWQTIADFTGDGRTDVIGWNGSYSAARVHVSQGGVFAERSIPFTWSEYGIGGAWGGHAGDYNGDGRVDFLGWNGGASSARLQLASPGSCP
jgi:hypothetical protein